MLHDIRRVVGRRWPLARLVVSSCQVQGVGAESWKQSEDGAYWDFFLRKGLEFSDGEPITADDWVFTAEHLSDPNLDTPWVWYYYDIKGIRAHKAGDAGPE